MQNSPYDRFQYRYQDIDLLPKEQYVGFDFSHSTIRADLSNIKFKNCIFYNTDFTKSNINETTEFDFSRMQNPFTSKKVTGELKAKATKEQMQFLTNQKVNGVTVDSSCIKGRSI